MAPANQPRLSLTGSEDGEAETETSRAAKPLWRKTNRPSGPQGPNLTEPPGADPHAGWCGRGERAIVPPIPLTVFSTLSLRAFYGESCCHRHVRRTHRRTLCTPRKPAPTAGACWEVRQALGKPDHPSYHLPFN